VRAALVALMLLAACRTSAPQDRSQPYWPRHILATGADGAPGYSIAMPPDVARRHVEGIDSEVAEFARPGLRIAFDYGWYGGFAECGGRPSCRQWEETIGGRTWRLSSAPPDVEVGGGWVRRFLSAHVRLGERMSLAVNSACASESECERALAVVRTIEFGNYPSASAAPTAPQAHSPPPSRPAPEPPVQRACSRVDAREARAFPGLVRVAAYGAMQVFGRPGELACGPPGADGSGRCRAERATLVRLEFPEGTSGFRIHGREPAVLDFTGTSFNCRGASDRP
jgi:hypothetical protein